jgi:hypothetical protein
VLPGARRSVVIKMSDFPTPGCDVDAGLDTRGLLGSRSVALSRLFFSVNETCALLGNASRASIYRWIAAGRLDARKIDGKTIVMVESIAQFAADLPKANIRPAPPPKSDGDLVLVAESRVPGGTHPEGPHRVPAGTTLAALSDSRRRKHAHR